MKDFHDLKRFAESCGFFVTATVGGNHNVGSKHYSGLAIDVRTRDKTDGEIETFLRRCAAIGVRVRDERIKPEHQKVWSGAHLHLEIMPDTPAAVVKFQKENSLAPDGIVGQMTLNRLAAKFG